MRRCRRRRAAPARGIEHDGRRGLLGFGAERFGQRAHEFAQRGLGFGCDRRRRARDEKQRARLGGGETGEVGACTTQQRPPAATARL